MAARLPRSGMVAALISAICLALALAALTSPSTARAANGTCNFSEGWTCNYYGNSWPSGVKLWFESAGGNNQRNWFVNWGFDNAGGSVYKCSGFKSFDGGELPQGCNNAGASYLSIPAHRRPGWVYIVQHAGAPRNIQGQALH